MKTSSTIRILSLFTLGIFALVLTGCGEKADEVRASILNQAETTVNTVKDTATNIQDQALKTKASVEQKVEDVQNAAKEVGEAVDAVKKATN